MASSQNRLLVVPIGVIAGHGIGYRVAHPGTLDRAASLGSSHDYLGPAALVSVVAAVIGVAWVAFDALRSRDRIPTTFVLARWQAAAFLILEVGERIGTHDSPVAAAASERAVWVGLAVQVLLAYGATRILRTTKVVVEAIVGAERSRSRRLPVRPPRRLESFPALRLATMTLGRAPPRFSIA